jgi:hypothetical protein
LKISALISRFYVLQEHAAHRKVFGYAARAKLKTGDGQREAGPSFVSLDPGQSDSQNLETQINERRMSNSQERDAILLEIQGITEMVQPGTEMQQEALGEQDGFQTPRRPVRPQTTPSLHQHPLINTQSAPQRSLGTCAPVIIANRIPVGAQLLAASMTSSQSNYYAGSGTKTGKRSLRYTPQNGHGGNGRYPLQFQTPARGESPSLYASTPAGSISRQQPPSVTPKSIARAHANAVVNVGAGGSGYVTPERIEISRNQDLFLSSQAPRTTFGRNQPGFERIPNSRLQPSGLLPRLTAVGKAISHHREHPGSLKLTLKVVNCFKFRAIRCCVCEWVSGSADDISGFLTTLQAPNLNSVNPSHVLTIFSDQKFEGGDILPGHVLYVWPSVGYEVYNNELILMCHGRVQQSATRG